MVPCNGRDDSSLLFKPVQHFFLGRGFPHFHVWTLCRVTKVQREGAWLGEAALLLPWPQWMANLLFPKELARDFLALVASKGHSFLQNPTERTGKYHELENTSIIPSYKIFPTSWKMKERPGACLQNVLRFNSWMFSWVKPGSKYVRWAYVVGLLSTVRWELLSPVKFQGQKGECSLGGESQESGAAACRDLHGGSSATAWSQSAPWHRCWQPCACPFLGTCSHFEL